MLGTKVTLPSAANCATPPVTEMFCSTPKVILSPLIATTVNISLSASVVPSKRSKVEVSSISIVRLVSTITGWYKVKKPALALPSSPSSFVTRKSKERSRVSVLVLEKDNVCKANAKTSSRCAKLTGAASTISASV